MNKAIHHECVAFFTSFSTYLYAIIKHMEDRKMMDEKRFEVVYKKIVPSQVKV